MEFPSGKRYGSQLRNGCTVPLLDFPRTRRRKGVGVVGFYAPCRCQTAVVGVYRNKKVGLRLVGKVSALIEWEVVVSVAREDDFRPQPRLEQFTEAPGYVEDQILLQ